MNFILFFSNKSRILLDVVSTRPAIFLVFHFCTMFKAILNHLLFAVFFSGGMIISVSSSFSFFCDLTTVVILPAILFPIKYLVASSIFELSF